MKNFISSREHNIWRRKRPSSMLLLSLIAISSTACNAKIPGSESMNASSQPKYSEAQRAPLRNLNPSPTKSYDIRVVLKDPPGPFAEVVAAAQYDVINAGECGERQPLSGAIPRISSSEPMELTKVSDTEYIGRVYVDRILDEDYYGRGTCRWEFVEARVGLRASADPRPTSFVAAIDAASMILPSPNTTFFSARHYPNASLDNYSSFGRKTPDQVTDAFEVVMSAREAGQ